MHKIFESMNDLPLESSWIVIFFGQNHQIIRRRIIMAMNATPKAMIYVIGSSSGWMVSSVVKRVSPNIFVDFWSAEVSNKLDVGFVDSLEVVRIVVCLVVVVVCLVVVVVGLVVVVLSFTCEQSTKRWVSLHWKTFELNIGYNCDTNNSLHSRIWREFRRNKLLFFCL